MRRRGFVVPDEVLTASDINSTEKVLFSFLNNREFNSGPYGEDLTQPEISRIFNLSLVTTNQALKNLESKGYIESRRVKYGENNRFRNVYSINWKGIDDKFK